MEKKNGTPGSARTVRLRGISKLLQTAPPAVILDGGFSPEKLAILEDLDHLDGMMVPWNMLI